MMHNRLNWQNWSVVSTYIYVLASKIGAIEMRGWGGIIHSKKGFFELFHYFSEHNSRDKYRKRDNTSIVLFSVFVEV